MKPIRIVLQKRHFNVSLERSKDICPITNYLLEKGFVRLELCIGWTFLSIGNRHYTIPDKIRYMLGYDAWNFDLVLNQGQVDKMFKDRKFLVFYAIPE